MALRGRIEMKTHLASYDADGSPCLGGPSSNLDDAGREELEKQIALGKANERCGVKHAMKSWICSSQRWR